MRILLDTHITLWMLSQKGLFERKVSRDGRRLIAGADAVCVSAASIWETAIKVATGKLSLSVSELLKRLAEANVQLLPITSEHAARAPDFAYPDPFDCMLVAQADIEPLHLVTVDEKLAALSRMVVVV